MAKIYLKKVDSNGLCSSIDGTPCYFGKGPKCTFSKKIKDNDKYLNTSCEFPKVGVFIEVKRGN